MPDAVTHPSAQELAAFGLGKLPGRSSAAVAAHLAVCDVCRQAVANLPPDSFLARVRDAGTDASTLPPAVAPGGATVLPNRARRPAPPANVPPELAGHPKYRILRELGRGGMGVVYQARQTMMNRQVVIKVISQSLLAHPDALERFRREVRAAAQLSHPNIVTAYDAEQAGDSHFLVMELVPGQSLAEVLARKGPLPVAHACSYVRQAALGLQHAFERGMVHRDIKPHNLMLTPRGQVKILDFGLAKAASERGPGQGLTASGAYMGTPEYSAPEQAQDARSADIRADLYSLGCTLYCLLAGRPPFQEESAVTTILAHLRKEPAPLPEVRPDVPAELWAVVARLLAKDPARRYQTPAEVAEALAPFARPGAKVVPAPRTVPPGVTSPARVTGVGGDTSRAIGRGRGLPDRAVQAPAGPPGEEEDSPFRDLGAAPATPPREVKKGRGAAGPEGAWWKRPPAMLAGGTVALLALAVGVWLLAAVVLKVKTADGDAVIVLEIDQPGAEVSVDGGKITVTTPEDNRPVEIRVAPERKHRLQVTKEGFKVFGEEVAIDAGNRRSITVRLEREPAVVEPPPPAEDPPQPKSAGPAAAAERPITGNAVPAFRPVDDAILRFMDTTGAQAATVAVSRDGKLLYSRGYGWRDADRQIPTPPDALMRIASVSKPITAAEVKTLIRDKKLTLGTRVVPLLGLKPYNGQEGDPRLDTITVGQLLEHKGGWDRDKSYDPMFMTGDIARALGLTKAPTPANVVEYMLAQPLQFTPGERSAYSNFGYCVLGRVIEKVTGLPYGEAVRRDVLRPLDIRDIELGHSAARDRDPREVWYPVADDAFSVEVMDAHGGWVASAPALCRFLDAYWVSGEPRRHEVGQDWTFFGGLDGTTSMARQRPDGLNVAVLLNKEADGEPLRKAVDEALDRLAGQVRFAALWEKREGPAWEARHALSADDYQKEFDRLGAQGYRPVWISGYSEGGQPRFAAVWEKREGPAWVGHHNLTADEYQKAFDQDAAAGYRLTFVNGSSVGGQARYAAVWEQRQGPAWTARHGLTADEYQKEWTRLASQGYRPVSLSGYEEGGEARYAAVWEQRQGPPLIVRHGLTADEYQKVSNKWTADGYRPVLLSAYGVAGEARFAAVWERRQGPPWVARHGLTGDEYQKLFDQLTAQGYRLTAVCGYNVRGDQ